MVPTDFDFCTFVVFFYINVYTQLLVGTEVAQWLKYCATNQKATGSIPEGVAGIFHSHNPSDRTMALGSTQPLTEMSTGVFPGGKSGQCVRLTTLPSSCAVVMKSVNLNFLEPSGPLQACNGTALALHLPLLLEDDVTIKLCQHYCN
jgi:hypothetical protein